MTFVNYIMLFGLAAVAIPIIIHILNRRRAKVVDWGAMMFLEASLASRNRRILIEDILLMALRCLLLGLLALALARPRIITGRLLAGEGRDAQDVAIVLDGSLSMTLESEGKSAFARAVGEARQVLDVCRPSDAVSVILAGPTPQLVVPSPLSDRQEVKARLDELLPPGGCLGAVEALCAAPLSLRGGGNPAKKVVLITDAQRIGWDLSANQRWSFLAETHAALPTTPTVIVRTLETPRQWRNASAAGMSFSRAVIGADRPVKITVTVANTGHGGIVPEAVELTVNGKVLDRRPVGAIAEGASATVIFEHPFEQSGPHIVAAHVVCPDDLPGDNQTVRVVDVLKTLPVLIVQGRSSLRPLESDGDFLRLALAPPPEDGAGKIEQLVRPTVVAVAEAGTIKSLDGYAVVVLADAPRLPGALAKAIGEFVAAGGGLLVAPGEKAEGKFYDAWNAADEKRLLGCRLLEFRDAGKGPDGKEQFLHVAPNTIDHPALRLLADPSVSDLAAAQVRRRWVLSPDQADARDSGVSLAASLDSGEPWLIQRKVGRGFVLTLSVPLDGEFSDLPVHECYVPLVHELVYYLAAPSQQPMNILPGQQFVYAIPGSIRAGDVAEVFTPEGKRLKAALQQRQGRWQATFAMTAAPGLYRLALPEKGLGELATRPAVAGSGSTGVPPVGSGSTDTGQRPVLPEPTGQRPVPPTSRGGAPGPSIPFVVLGEPGESKLELLTDEDYARARQFVPLERAETLSELTAAIQGHVPGKEVWQYLALVLAALLGGEILTTRVITVRRQAHRATPVAFGPDQVDAEEFRSASRPGKAAAVRRTVEVGRE